MNHETAGFHEAALLRMVEDRGGVNELAKTNSELAALFSYLQPHQPNEATF